MINGWLGAIVMLDWVCDAWRYRDAKHVFLNVLIS
jgi:hypothetical protein